MATFVKFNQFVEDIAHGVHDLETHQLQVVLTTNANTPAATNAVLADLTVVATGNGWTSPTSVTTTSSGQTSGTYQLVLTDASPLFTASGGSVTFRNVVLFNTNPTTPADPLIGYWAYPTADVTVNDGESFNVDFAAFTVQIV